jgi:biotin operon repressor
LDRAEIERLLGRPPRMTVEHILGHPQLPQARRAYLDSFLEVYDGDPFLIRLLIESGRFFVYYIILLLESAYDPARRETWPTVGLVKETMAAFGMGRASDRHIDHLLARLCTAGCLESHPSEHDRRVRILTTGERLRQHDRDWLVAHYTPLALLCPDHDYRLVLERDPQFQVIHRRASIPFMGLGATLMADIPDVMMFFDHAAGPVVVAALLQAAMAQGDDRSATVSYAEVGDRLGVSRTHVRQLLAAAEERGLLKLHARGGRRVELLPRMWSSHDAGMARGMYFHDILYLAATAGNATTTPPAPAPHQPSRPPRDARISR